MTTKSTQQAKNWREKAVKNNFCPRCGKLKLLTIDLNYWACSDCRRRKSINERARYRRMKIDRENKVLQ